MKPVSFFFLLLICQPLWSQDAWSDKSRVLPDLLRKIPVALIISHHPNPNYPEETNDDSYSKYVWRHSTSIWSPDINLQVVTAGSYVWYNEEGWKQNIVLSKKEFTKLFNCPKGKIEKDTIYTFEKNHRYGNNLYGGDALWFVIAKDESGNHYKGTAIIETESELKPSK